MGMSIGYGVRYGGTELSLWSIIQAVNAQQDER